MKCVFDGEIDCPDTSIECEDCGRTVTGMANVEDVIKAWNCCNPFNRKCKECPYEKDCYHDGISRHMVADAIAMMKSQQAEIERLKGYINEFSKNAIIPVRCKDCKYAILTYSGECKYCMKRIDDDGGMDQLYLPGDWYCADGERKKQEDSE